MFLEAPQERKIIVCHNYGHDSFGYSASWGASYEALKLINDAIKQQKVTAKL